MEFEEQIFHLWKITYQKIPKLPMESFGSIPLEQFLSLSLSTISILESLHWLPTALVKTLLNLQFENPTRVCQHRQLVVQKSTNRNNTTIGYAENLTSHKLI